MDFEKALKRHADNRLHAALKAFCHATKKGAFKSSRRAPLILCFDALSTGLFLGQYVDSASRHRVFVR
jgi:hypothetical protein